MALSTYTELKAAIADWLNRSDLTSQIPDFIRLTESRLNREFSIRTIKSDVSLTGTVGSRSIALPTGFREALNLWILRSGARNEIKRYINPDLLTVDPNNASEPYYWAVDGANIVFERPCDQAYSFVLRMEGSLTLSDAAPTNLILTNYPDLYLFGACAEAGPFLRDNDLAATFEAKFQAALTDARAKESRSDKLTTLRTEPAALNRYNRRSGYNIRVDG